MNIRAYYSEGSASVAFFDVLAAVDPVASDIDLYCDLIPTAGSVLELGSGTGRVSEALANHGYDVTGLELAEPMLKLARARQPHGLKLRYVQGDMCAFDLGRQFDAVICPFYGLAHLPSAEWPRVFAAVAKHLRPNGIGAFNLPIASEMAAPAPPVGSAVLRQGGLTVRMAGKCYDAATGRMDLDLRYEVAAGASIERLTLYSGDADLCAREAGLVVDRPPVPLGKGGFVHIYHRPRS